jgi:Rha family phage regulatory protein
MNVVQLSTMDITSARPITTSLIVAEYFEKDHKRVLRDIRELMSSLKDGGNFAPILFVEDAIYLDAYGREKPMYQMNEEFWMLLVMSYTGAKAAIIQIEFIKAFNLAKNELLARQNTRHIGKAMRNSLTDSIKNHTQNGTNFKKFAYSNYTRLVYKRVLGMDVKKAKDIRCLKESDNLRDFLTMEEIEKVQSLESKIAAFIEVSDTDGKDDKQVYQMVKEWLDKTMQKQVTA